MGLLDETLQSPRELEEADEEVLARSIRDPRAFELLVTRYEDAFLRKAVSIVRNQEAAEDIVQEAFAKIYLNAHRFKKVEGASFKSWGYRILINTALTTYSRRKRDFEGLAPLEPEHYESLPDADDLFERTELREYLISMLSRIPDQFERILRLHFLEGKPHKEIAKAEGLSVPAVKTRIHRAKNEIRKVAQKLNTPFVF